MNLNSSSLCHPERSEGSFRHLMLVFRDEIVPPACHRARFNRPFLLVSGQQSQGVLPIFEPCLIFIMALHIHLHDSAKNNNKCYNIALDRQNQANSKKDTKEEESV